MPTAFVTGAAGFIGSHLVDSLIDRGWTVRGIDNLSTGDRDNLSSVLDSERFEFVEGDICDSEVVSKLTNGVDHVFHQAAVASVPKSFETPRSTTETNCTGTATVVQAAVDNDVESVAVASSAAVYGSGGPLPKREDQSVSPESPYASSKRYTEQIARQVGGHGDVNVAALRYFNVYGPRQDPDGEYAAAIPKFIDLLLAGEAPVIFGDGEQTRDFVYVGDVVTANIEAALSNRTGVYNVATGESVTINELIDTLKTIIGMNVSPTHESPRTGDIRHSSASVSKAADELGFRADTSLEDGLTETVEGFRKT
ncbi:NAD-dependent epimerase/dehydratase family protein [Halorubrum sp. CSM-61]|uniref:NAD-dependent epimerase/dehydratase family protein n=1 Tax=Halorubrum sp. CSM-61 TaxID=2485838 RepID=UPI000F4BA54B|nr:NAD-dependent epimerase/dehydratase family protein [Halorubrum sp. CSM-61]